MVLFEVKWSPLGRLIEMAAEVVVDGDDGNGAGTTCKVQAESSAAGGLGVVDKDRDKDGSKCNELQLIVFI